MNGKYQYYAQLQYNRGDYPALESLFDEYDAAYKAGKVTSFHDFTVRKLLDVQANTPAQPATDQGQARMNRGSEV